MKISSSKTYSRWVWKQRVKALSFIVGVVLALWWCPPPASEVDTYEEEYRDLLKSCSVGYAKAIVQMELDERLVASTLVKLQTCEAVLESNHEEAKRAPCDVDSIACWGGEW